jgi:hypothetical protein
LKLCCGSSKSILRALLSPVTDPIARSLGYRTTRVLMPVLSFESVYVEDSPSRAHPSAPNQLTAHE